MCVHRRGRSGFTREYGGGGNGERRVGDWPAGPASSRVNPLLRATVQALPLPSGLRSGQARDEADAGNTPVRLISCTQFASERSG